MKEGIKMKRKTKKKILAGSVFLGATATFSYLLTNYFVKLAMDREVPKSAKNASNLVSGKKSDDFFEMVLKEKGKELESKQSTTVEINGFDDTKLVGHLYEVKNPKRILIAMHGWRIKWSTSFGITSEDWFDNDCTVLFAEQRGQNNSGGDYIGFGTLERYDCQSWAYWLKEKYGDELPIYLVGVSMGATTVLLASNLELPKNVHGIIADCGFSSTDAEWRHIVNNNLHLAYGIKSIYADKLFQAKIKDESSHLSTIDSLKETNIPILFIHGSDDRFVPVSMTYDNYLACNSPKELLIVPGADHSMSYFVEKKKYIQTVLDFWDKYDQY